MKFYLYIVLLLANIVLYITNEDIVDKNINITVIVLLIIYGIFAFRKDFFNRIKNKKY